MPRRIKIVHSSNYGPERAILIGALAAPNKIATIRRWANVCISFLNLTFNIGDNDNIN